MRSRHVWYARRASEALIGPESRGLVAAVGECWSKNGLVKKWVGQKMGGQKMENT